MITIYVDSYNRAAEVHEFIQDTLNTYGCISLGDILYVAGYPHTTYTYDNIFFMKNLRD